MSGKPMVDRFLDAETCSRTTRSTYASILRTIDGCAGNRRLAAGVATTETLRAWLQEQVQRSPLRSAIYRTCVIARYLEWRQANGQGNHPLLELRAQYGGQLSRLVQALLEDDYASALQRLKPRPEWGSALGSTMREHIARMQSLGYRYDARARDLRTFDRFLQRHPELASAQLPQLLAAWSADRPGVRHQLRVQQCGQILSKALHRKDVAAPILPIELGLHSRVVQQERRPHFFTEAEVRTLLATARSLPSKRAPLRPIVLHAIVTLAYCAGLRIGEIVSLKLGDLDMDAGLLEIRQTKFFKTRRLPLAASALCVLRDYLHARAASGAPMTPDAPMWWIPMCRCGYSRVTVQHLLTSLMRQAGLKPERGRRGPRVHDLRHTFVAHRMMQWYREGVHPQAYLPHLATYLGHKEIASTLVYLHITPELLQSASERHRRLNAGALRASEGRQ